MEYTFSGEKEDKVHSTVVHQYLKEVVPEHLRIPKPTHAQIPYIK